MTNNIGKKIKQLRNSRTLSQQELADKVNITRSTISNYEIGRRTPHLKDLQKLAEVFGVGLDFFGIQPTDEAFNLISRAQEVFESPDIDENAKEELYRELMKLYLKMKEGK